jgi:hypothetical protein
MLETLAVFHEPISWLNAVAAMHTPSRHGRLIVDVPLANRDTGLVTGLTLFIELPVGGGILRSYTLRTTRLFRFPQLEGVRRPACHARVRVPTHARTPVPVRGQ